MSNQENTSTIVSNDDKNNISHVEDRENDDFQKAPVNDRVDEFGAATKTDPKEIALVKKLDWYMMVSIFSGFS